jgi:hypothetical protein
MIRAPYLLIALSVIFFISACTGPKRLEIDYGNSVNLSKSNQILDPNAQENLEPVTGMDGMAAQTSIDRYRKNFEQSPKNSQYSFNMGGPGGSQDSQDSQETNCNK